MNFKSLLTLVLLFFTLSYFAQNSQKHSAQKPSNPNKMLLENNGQWPEGVLFRSNMNGGKVWIQQHKLIYHLQDYSAMHKAHAMKTPDFTSDEIKETLVHLNFVGSNKVYSLEKKGKTKEYYNFFKGKDPSKWASDVHGYQEVVLQDFYTNIDLRYLGGGDEMKYEFIVSPKADPAII